MKQLITYFPLQRQKTKLLLLHKANDSKNQNQTNQKTKKIVSQHSLFSDKNWSKVFMKQWIASTILPTQSEKAQKIIKQIALSHSL